MKRAEKIIGTVVVLGDNPNIKFDDNSLQYAHEAALQIAGLI